MATRRRSGMQDFLDNFNAAFDTTGKVARGLELGRVGREQVEDLGQGYTEADAEHLHAIANARDAQGNPYYQLQGSEDGSYGVAPTFDYTSPTGLPQGAGSVAGTLEPGRVSQFMGQRYNTDELTDDRVRGLRQRAMADVEMRYDPMQGMRMHRDIGADERDIERHGWDRDMQGLRMSAAWRDERKGRREENVQDVLDSVAKMSDEQLGTLVGNASEMFPGLNISHTGRTKDGYMFVTEDPDSGQGQTFNFTHSQMRKLGAAAVLQSRGMGAESMELMGEVDKDFRSYVKDLNDRQDRLASSYNNALAKQHTLDHQRQTQALGWARLQAQQAARKTDAGYKPMSQSDMNAFTSQLERHLPEVDDTFTRVGADGKPEEVTITREYLADMVAGAQQMAQLNHAQGIAMTGAEAAAAWDAMQRGQINPPEYSKSGNQWRATVTVKGKQFVVAGGAGRPNLKDEAPAAPQPKQGIPDPHIPDKGGDAEKVRGLRTAEETAARERLNMEVEEIVQGQRRALSPEAQATQDALHEAWKQGDADYLAREQERMRQQSRGLAARH